MATRYRVKNWRAYQYYKKRNPPWIMLYYDILTSQDWVTISDSSRVLMIVCLLIASRNNGFVPGDPEYLKRVAFLNTTPDFSELLKTEFIEIVPELPSDLLHADACKFKHQNESECTMLCYVYDYEGGVGEKSAVHAMPENLDTVSFRSAWDRFKAYRKESGHGVLQPITEIENLTALSAMGPNKAERLVRLAIRNGWKNIALDAEDRRSGPVRGIPEPSVTLPTGKQLMEKALADLEAQKMLEAKRNAVA